MVHMSAYDSILFDLDGTLWDATAVTAEAWTEVLPRHPEITVHIDRDTVRKYMGMTNEELVSLIFPHMSFEEGFALIDEVCEEENRLLREKGGILYPDVASMLIQLSERYPLFIVSNCQAGYVEAFLDYHGFSSVITDHLCPGDTGEAKAENILTICRKYSLQNPLYIGDTMGDYAAAKKARCSFIHAAYGFGRVPAENCNAVLQCPADLLHYMDLR